MRNGPKQYILQRMGLERLDLGRWAAVQSGFSWRPIRRWTQSVRLSLVRIWLERCLLGISPRSSIFPPFSLSLSFPSLSAPSSQLSFPFYTSIQFPFFAYVSVSPCLGQLLVPSIFTSKWLGKAGQHGIGYGLVRCWAPRYGIGSFLICTVLILSLSFSSGIFVSRWARGCPRLRSWAFKPLSLCILGSRLLGPGLGTLIQNGPGPQISDPTPIFMYSKIPVFRVVAFFFFFKYQHSKFFFFFCLFFQFCTAQVMRVLVKAFLTAPSF